MKKRVLSLLLCLVFLLTLLPAVTLADPQTSGDYRDLHWEYNTTNGRLDLSRADEGPMPEFEETSDVPWAAFRASITFVALNSTFTSISTYAFYGCTALTSFDVPASVTSIGYGAFQGCTGLRTLSIGSGVRMIGAYAFNGCSALTSLNIPNGVTALGNYAFQNCTSLNSLTIGSGVTSIPAAAFMGCTSLTSLEIPDTVTKLNSSAFRDCSGITSLTIPGDVTIYQDVFTGCTKVQTITLTKGMSRKVATSNHTPWFKTNANCTVTLADGIILIDSMAFRYADKLTAITIPDSMIHVYGNAFEGCTGLKNVYYLGTKAQKDQIQIEGGNVPLTKAKWTFVDTGLNITQDPADLTVNNGQKATFSVKVKEKNVSCQWYWMFPGILDEWVPVAPEVGGNTATLSFVAVLDNNGVQFKCVVRNAAGKEKTTRVATLTVLPVLPVIKTQPKNVKVKSGALVKLSIKATGTGLTYQWLRRNSNAEDWGLIDGATAANYTFNCTMLDDASEYCCVVTNADGYVESNVATLTVIPQPATVKTHPKSTKVKSGATAKFSVKAIGPNLSYQWFTRPDAQSHWTEMAGETGANLNLVACMALNGTQYYCEVRNADGADASNIATLTVTPVAFAIKTNPKNVKVKSGAVAKLSVKATGAGLSYQWYRIAPRSKNLYGDKIEGATGADYSFTACMADDGYGYACLVTSADGEEQLSAPGILTVTPAAPKFSTQPKDAKVKAGDQAAFTVKASGVNVEYQWYYRTSKEGEWVLMDGETNATLTVQAGEDNFGWQFRCTAAAEGLTVDSKIVTLKKK
ncbi:MAG: leucine-rich repeat protein [Clostridia bacterium]|nr:leucine-rich repeat protein [Clostridia bacterium]